LKLAQGIVCGSWALAFSFDWARQIVEEFEIAAIPKSPPWLLGAANVEGNILPVIDLAVYFSPTTANMQAAPHQRLLVGGLTAAGADDAVALLFSGLPQQLNYQAQELTYAGALPLKLRETCDAIATDPAGRNFLEINVDKLMAVLADELSLL
jgi:chemotaxis signal transduction protein